MSETLPEMTPRTALGGRAPRVDTHGPVTLTEISDLALASVCARLGYEDACKARLGAWLQVPAVGQLVVQGAVSGFWIGPDQWMISAPHDSHEDLAARLVESCASAASITEQTDAWAVFDLQGEVGPVMELLSPINMRAFPAGSAQRTSMHHMGCFVTCHSADHLRILGPRSSAGSLHHALLSAMRSAH